MNTGKKIYTFLKQITISTGVPTGLMKANDPSDPDYVEPTMDYVSCPITTWLPINPSCEISGSANTGRLLYSQRRKLFNGIEVLVEDNLDGVGEGPYFPPIIDHATSPV